MLSDIDNMFLIILNEKNLLKIIKKFHDYDYSNHIYDHNKLFSKTLDIINNDVHYFIINQNKSYLFYNDKHISYYFFKNNNYELFTRSTNIDNIIFEQNLYNDNDNHFRCRLFTHTKNNNNGYLFFKELL